MANEEIAIVGIGCRFPGADNIDEFWRVLLNGEDHVKEIPIKRWNNDAFYDEDQTVSGKTYVRKAGLLKNHDRWDNRLFDISDTEARQIDPQQRYVLECVHMALEDGGITRKQVNGSNTGVIIGCMNNDYKAISNSNKADIGRYNTIGTSASLISARVSHVYNLQGTCLTLDTACSSALVAIHLASQAIQTGDCDMMICGGVNSILTPDMFVTLCKAHMLSPQGKCQSFCETADGYARGEGCGIVILKTLKAALEEGNKIWATIKTGINQDGSVTRPITAPSGEQQLQLLREVYERNKFDPADIQYIEAHGTGTPKGDPTELNSLGEFFHSFRQKSQPLLVGSVKSNIGHTESAASVAGLIKVLLMMRYGKYVPSLNVKDDKSNVNKKIKLAEYGLDIATSVRDWKSNRCETRYACLNSFGFGGSNTHAILSQKKRGTSADFKMPYRRKLSFCVSGIDQKSLELNLKQFHKDLFDCDDLLHNIATTSLLHRDIYEFRTLLHAEQISELQKECRERVLQVKQITPHKSHNVVFVYCGDGTTWTGMGQKLMQQNDVFTQKIKEIDEHLHLLNGLKIGPILARNSTYDEPELSIIAIFSIQIALTEVLRSLGVKPDKIVGQSIGEIAASYASNSLSLQEAVTIVCHVAKILSYGDEGSMVVIGNVNIEDIETLCEEYKYMTNIAVYNSPRCCTLSGNEKAIKLIEGKLKERNDGDKLFVRRLSVKQAYHSQPLKTPFHKITKIIDESLSKLCTTETVEKLQVIPMISTVTREIVTPSTIRNGSYWANNMLKPVLFMQSIQSAFDESTYNIFFEIGPQSVLKIDLPDIIKDYSKARTLSCLEVNNESNCLNSSIRELFELGVDIHLAKLAVTPIENEITKIPRCIPSRTIGLSIPKSFQDYLSGSFETDERNHMFVENVNGTDFRLCIDPISAPFVYDHFLSNTNIVPGATYVEAGFYVGTHCLQKPASQLSVNFSFIKTCSPSAEKRINLIVQFDKRTSNIIEFSILHDTKTLAIGNVSIREYNKTKHFNIENLQYLCPIYKSKTDCYVCLAELNFKYGESLCLIEEAWLSVTGEKCLTKIQFSEKSITVGAEKTHIHPAIIDAVFQNFGILQKESIGGKHFVIPKGVKSVRLHRHVETSMFVFAEKVAKTSTSTQYNAVLMTSDGEVIAEIDDFYTNIISSDDPFGEESLLYEVNWLEKNDNTVKSSDSVLNLFLLSNSQESIWLNEFGKNIRIQPIKSIEDLQWETFLEDKKNVLVYHVGSSRAELISQTEAQEIAVKRFMELKSVISTIEHSENRLVIITENTQTCPNRKNINLTGSELWGMIRSAFHEHALKNIKLIDIDPESIDTVVLSQIMFSKNESSYEYAIAGTTVFRPRLEATRRKKMRFRNIKADECKDLAIYAMELSDKRSHTYLSFAKTEKPLFHSKRICLQSVTLHDKAFFPSKLPHSIDTHLINEQVDGQIFALEGVGSTENGSTYLFLFPVRAQTFVYIPEECLIKFTICNTRVSGVLILVHILVQIALTVFEYSTVAVIRNIRENDDGQRMFDSLIKDKHCSISFFTIKELRRRKGLVQADTLILSQRFSFKHLVLCLSHLCGVKEIISLTAHAPKDLSALMSQLFPNVKLKLLNTEEMFELDRISQSIPVIEKFLIDLECLNRNIQNEFILPLPMKTLDIREQVLNGDLQLYCDESTLFRPDSCYIITGGASGLGWEILQLMVEMGAGMVVNFSWRKPSNELQKYMDSLAQRFSSRIISLQVDVSDMDSVKFGFNEIQNYYSEFSIKGIFHGAAVLSDSILEKLQEETINKVMHPKILGTLNLHQASINIPLDYFVLHSSIVSIIGNPGQCNYAAANSFLDTFAQYRRAQGRPAQSINWGPLAVGLATKSDNTRSLLERKGFKNITTDTIKDIFIEAMMNNSTNHIYSNIDWGKMMSIPTFQKQSFKFDNFLNQEKVFFSKKRREKVDIDKIKSLDDEEQKIQLKATLKEIIYGVMIIGNHPIEDDMPLSEIGLDSMAAMSLSNSIYDVFECRIPAVTLISDNSSISIIAEVVRTSFIRKDTINPDNKYISDSPNLRDNDLIDDTDASHIFSSDTISFMQYELLTRCKTQRNNSFNLRVIDVEILGLKCTIEEWKEMLLLVIKVHPELRKRFILLDDSELSAEIVPEREASPEITEVNETEFFIASEKDARWNLAFDIFDTMPVCFRIAHTNNSTLIRIVLHAVVFDMNGLSILCKTIEWAGLFVVQNSKEPYKYPIVDVTGVIRNAILPRMRHMRLFWSQNLNVDISPVTLGSTLKEVNANFCCIQNTDFPREKVSAIKVYVGKLGISVYEFFMSLYQIFLYIGSKTKTIVVGTAADMRFHVPELNNVVTRCTNYIPVMAYIDETMSFSDFIKRNSSRISETTQCGAYPSSLILKCVKTEEARENMFRHYMSINDMKDIRKLMNESPHVTAKIKKIWHMTPTRETFVYLRYDLQNNWMQIETGYNSEICGTYGKHMSNTLIELADVALNNENKCIAELKDEITKKVLASECDQLLNTTTPQVYSTQHAATKQNITILPTAHSLDGAALSFDVQADRVTLMCPTSVQREDNKLRKQITEEGDVGRRVLLANSFHKQTKRGWDHQVNVTLSSSLDGNSTILEWGKVRKLRSIYRRVMQLSEIKDISLRRTNGISSIIVVSKLRNLVLKTANKARADEWFETMQSLLQRSENRLCADDTTYL